MSPPFSAAVLTGGQSRRMGQDKAFLTHPLEGSPLWLRQVLLLQTLRPERVYLSQNRGQVFPARPGLAGVPDSRPGLGPLGGIASVLEVNASPLLLVLAVDLPAMIAAPLLFLLSQSRPGLGAVFTHGEFWEPLAAVYPQEALPLAQDHLQNGRLALRDWVAACVQAELVSLFSLPPVWKPAFSNINRPGDLVTLTASRS